MRGISWELCSGPLIGWKLWYADGSTTSSSEELWDRARATAVQVLMAYHPDGYRTVFSGYDIYTWPGAAGEKYGSEIRYEEHRRLLLAATAEAWRP